MVDVEAGVDLEDSSVEGIKHSTRAVLGVVRVDQNRERLLRGWELEVSVEVRGVIA